MQRIVVLSGLSHPKRGPFRMSRGGEMASVQIVHHWSADEITIVTVTAKTSYPDALAEAKATAISMFEDAVKLVTDAQAIAEP